MMKRLLLGVAVLAAVAAVGSAPAHGQDEPDIALVHALPGEPVDVVAGDTVVVAGLEPGTVQDISTLAGEVLEDVEVRAVDDGQTLIGPLATVEIPAFGSWSIVVHLDASGAPTISSFVNDETGLVPTTGRLTVRHVAAADALDLVVGETRPVQGISNGASIDLNLLAGPIEGVHVAPTGGEPIADVPPLDLVEGTNLMLYIAGSVDDGALTFYVEEQPFDDGAEGPPDAEPAPGTDGEAGEPPVDASMTPAPTAVNTGVPTPSSSNGGFYFAGAMLLAAVAVGAAVAHRRSGAGSP